MAEGGMNQGGEEVGMWLMRRHFSLACTMLDRPGRPPTRLGPDGGRCPRMATCRTSLTASLYEI